LLNHRPEVATGSSASRSALTNDPLRLPPGLSRSSALGRRWRDLAAAYSEQVGPERLRLESVRVLLGDLISFTLVAERQRARLATGDDVDVSHINQMIQLNQTIRGLLDRLGLSAAPVKDEEPGLSAYIAERTR
jgi:hypothetical protein